MLVNSGKTDPGPALAATVLEDDGDPPAAAHSDALFDTMDWLHEWDPGSGEDDFSDKDDLTAEGVEMFLTTY